MIIGYQRAHFGHSKGCKRRKARFTRCLPVLPGFQSKRHFADMAKCRPVVLYNCPRPKNPSNFFCPPIDREKMLKSLDKKHVKNLQWEFEKNLNFIDSDNSTETDWSDQEKITSDWIEMASSDEPDPFDYINTKLNLFQVIQLYLINDIYENHEGIYSTLYNIINDIRLNLDLKELNQKLSGYVSTVRTVHEIWSGNSSYQFSRNPKKKIWKK